MQTVSKMLQVRNLPDDVHAELKRRASAAGMSLSDFAGQELARLASRPALPELLDRVAERGGDRLTFAAAREAVVAERPEH